MNKTELTMLPWGTPASGVNDLETAWLFLKVIFLLLRKMIVNFVIQYGVLI